MLYVSEPWRARGVGRALMAAVMARARESGCDRVEWNVLADNSRAQAFYSAFGAAEKVGWRRWGAAV